MRKTVTHAKESPIGKRLADLMLANGGMSDNELAQASGVSQPTISRILSGDTDPHPNTIRRLAHYFKIPPEELMVDAPPQPEASSLSIDDRVILHALHSLPSEKRMALEREILMQAAIHKGEF